MSDIVDQINEVHRETGRADTPGGEARTVLLRRSYPAPVEDVWDAVTDAKRISRWFLPVSGDLRLGGRYQLEGNAGGEILRCEPPRLLKVSWIFGEAGGHSEVEVRLTPRDAESTVFELEHVAVTDPKFWTEYGPGATGVGWDLGLLGLSLHLSGRTIENPQEWESSPEAREFATLSSNAWGAASAVAGIPPEDVARMVANTTAFYAPDPPNAGGEAFQS
ncbi:SRPBCC family protein [Plantactinospora sp. CA-290183]|uniref:SRPBCC family protein n=1 Tax=Plantactinospora sp. CA-290183 TaxID=3240006 RepID=UPI003D8DD428